MAIRCSRLLFQFITILVFWFQLIGEAEHSNATEFQPVTNAHVYVVPIKGQIMPAHLFILRRALKEAIAENVQTVVLDIHTPGGSLETTLEMMNALEKFQGDIIAYVNTEAISAGSYLAIAADKIYFEPNGIMGAAAVIESTGQDISSTLKKKIDSYLKARIRNLSQDYPYRGDVQRAMMDEDFVFQIDGTILKDKGELLSLTAKEAIKEYGNPVQKLLAKGVVSDVKALLDIELGANQYTIQAFEITGAERAAKFLQSISPILMGLGLMLLFIEFKTPGFGWIGALGIGCLLTVFVSNHIAGLAGYEAVILFGLALICFFLELFVFSGLLSVES
jgi:membrane-bound serine protease (ClpP class)